jgi:hypothetical protein
MESYLSIILAALPGFTSSPPPLSERRGGGNVAITAKKNGAAEVS